MSERQPNSATNSRLRLTRRALLEGMSSMAVAAALAGGCSNDGREGRPWSDKTFFDDGTGWIEEPST